MEVISDLVSFLVFSINPRGLLLQMRGIASYWEYITPSYNRAEASQEPPRVRHFRIALKIVCIK